MDDTAEEFEWATGMGRAGGRGIRLLASAENLRSSTNVLKRDVTPPHFSLPNSILSAWRSRKSCTEDVPRAGSAGSKFILEVFDAGRAGGLGAAGEEPVSRDA